MPFLGPPGAASRDEPVRKVLEPHSRLRNGKGFSICLPAELSSISFAGRREVSKKASGVFSGSEKQMTIEGQVLR